MRNDDPGVSGPVATPAPCPVADTMRRVQALLAAGEAPSYESLLAYGEPRRR